MIRFGNLKDIKSVNIIRKQVNDIHVKGEPEIFKGFSSELADYVNEFVDNDKKKLLVLEEDNIIYGYAMIEFVIKEENAYRYQLKFLEVHELGVLESNKGRGYGRKLMDKVKLLAIENGFKEIRLDAWVCNSNAINFYKKIGYDIYREYFRLKI